MDYNKLAEMLFPKIESTTRALEEKYPQRNLPNGAKVTRMAPSPTGFMHLGNLFGAITDERLAHQSGGVFYLRIEDTDQKREVPGGVKTIVDVFANYRLPFDEGVLDAGQNEQAASVEKGNYGPYHQRRRAQIYHVCAKQLVQQGKAYPCFLTEEELLQMREKQAAQKLNFGCYGQFAKYRDATLQQVESLLLQGHGYVLRYRSQGQAQNRIKVDDLVRGTLDLPENDQDVVLLKKDGIPTYHFAHVVDDHLMRTNVVVRGEEWLATLPIHVQLFAAMGWKAPKYLHTAHIMKMEGNSKRKLSKRKDPELALGFYSEKGYTVSAVKEYLMSLLNSNFEDWRTANPNLPLEDFAFSVKKMSVSGALFSTDKLNDVSRGVLSRMPAQVVMDELLAWAQQYSPQFAALLLRDKAYSLAMLGIGRAGKKPRKDLTFFKEAEQYFGFFFEELFCPNYILPNTVPANVAKEMLQEFANVLNTNDNSQQFFEKIKAIAQKFGYASDMRDFKENPQKYPGSVADVSMVARLAVTGRTQSPDLAEIMQVMGKDMVCRRIEAMKEKI